MENSRKETFNRFTTSNALFFQEYRENQRIRVDKDIKVELMMVYLLLYKDRLITMKDSSQIIKLLETQNYTLGENSLFFEGQEIPIASLYEYVIELEAFKKMEGSNKINATTHNLLQETRDIILTKDTPALLKCSLFDQATRNKMILAKTIVMLLSGRTDYTFTLKEISLLFSIVSLYPVACYDTEEIIKKENLHISQANVNIRRFGRHDEIKSELKEEKMKEKEECGVNNTTLIHMIWTSLIQATFDPTAEENNPLITLYYLKDEEVESCMYILLNTLFVFIDNDEVAKELETISLKKENRGETT